MKLLRIFISSLTFLLYPFCHSAFAEHHGTPGTVDAEVAPYRLIAADFARVTKQVVRDPAAYDGRILRHSGHLILLNIPCPRTSKDLSVYVKVRAENPGDRLVLGTLRNGERVSWDTLDRQTAGQWAWVRFKAMPSKVLGDWLRLDAVPSKKGGHSISLDSIVVATDPTLTDEALDKAPLWLPDGPMAVVNHTETPPSLNGKGDDLVWNRAVAIGDFLAFSTGIPALLRTTTRFLYDDRHLYVQFIVDEPLLRAADMRMEELFMRATERDQTTPHDVISDDACMLMLQPQQEGPVYEWSVNTLGTLLDARMEPTDLWKTRDVGWNADGVVSVVNRLEGAWVWEMAIPMENLGINSPQPGATWNVAIVRLSPSRKEFSAWNPTGEGAHRPGKWGTLRFGGAGEGASLALAKPLAEISPGTNAMSLSFTAGVEASQLVVTALSPEKGLPALAWTTVEGKEEMVDTAHRFEVRESVSTRAQWGFFNAHTMESLYVSPPAQLAVRSTELTLTLSAPGPYEVVVNDTVVASGPSAKGERIELSIRHGANPIAIRASAGVSALELAGAHDMAIPQVWRVKAERAPGATAAAFDDREWPLVSAQELPLQAGEEVVFRRLIFSQHTTVWPVPSPAVFVAQGSSQPVSFKFNGLPGRPLEGWATWVAIPETLEATGVSGFYGTAPKQPLFNLERDGTVEIGGKALVVYKITADKPLYFDEHHLPAGRRGIFHLMLRVAGEAPPSTKQTERLYYWSQAEKGGVFEMSQSFNVETLPPLNGKQPKKFVFELWGSSFGRLDDVSVRRQALETMQQAGFNLLVDHGDWTIQNSAEYGITTRPIVNFSSWSINLGPYLEKHPQEQLVQQNGRRNKQSLCTSLLIGARWQVVSEIFASHLRQLHATTICYDFEFSSLTGPHSCYCQRCLDAFRAEKVIAPEREITAEVIETTLRKEWDDFMARRAARLLGNMRATVHETIPEGIFTVFSLPQSPRTVSIYGIDWRYVVENKGADVVQVGNSGTWEQITHTSEVIGETPVMYGVWMPPYTSSHMVPARVASKAELLRRVLDSTHGILLYDRIVMDGRSWLNVAEVTRLVAEFEGLFLNSRPEAVTGHDPEAAQWLRGKEKHLLCLMNSSDQARSFRIELPATGVANGYEYYSGVSLGDAGALQVDVPPNESVVYVFDAL